MKVRCSLLAIVGFDDSLCEQPTHAWSVELDCGGETLRVLH